MLAAVTAIVVGAGISTAICGSMLGIQTFEANCHARMRTIRRIKFGSIARTRKSRVRSRLRNDGAAPAVLTSLTGATRLLCIYLSRHDARLSLRALGSG